MMGYGLWIIGVIGFRGLEYYGFKMIMDSVAVKVYKGKELENRHFDY